MRSARQLSVTILLLAAAALSATACGGGKDTTNTTQTVSQSEVTGKVTVWDILSGFSPTYANTAKKLDAAFEAKYPNVTIDRVEQPFESYTALYRAAFAAHEGPDIMSLVAGQAGVLSFTEGLEPLNKWISPELAEKLEGWEAATPNFAKDGERYGIPIGKNGFVFYYNKKMFKEAGLPTNFQPETWSAVEDAAEKLKAAGIQPFVGGNKEGFENSSWLTVAWQTMNTVQQSTELNQGKLPYTSKIVANAFGPLLATQEKGFYPSDRFSTPQYPTGAEALGEEKGAMTLGLVGGSVSTYVEYVPKLGAQNVGFFFPPGSTYIGYEPNMIWSIPKFAANKAAAWAYLEFLSSREGMQMIVESNPGELPNRTDVELPKGLAPQAYEIEATIRQHKVAPLLQIMLPATVWEAVWKELNQVLQGRMSLEDAQKALQETSERALGT